MPRTKEAVDITPGVKTAEYEISKLNKIELATPIKYTASWTVLSLDEVVSLLSSNPNEVLEKLASAAKAEAVASAKADAIDANEPREMKIARFVKIGMEKFGMSEETAKNIAEQNFPA